MPNLKKNLVHYIEFGCLLLNEWDYIEQCLKFWLFLRNWFLWTITTSFTTHLRYSFADIYLCELNILLTFHHLIFKSEHDFNIKWRQKGYVNLIHIQKWCRFSVWIVLLDIRNVSNFNIWGWVFWLESLKIAWKGTLIFIYVIEWYWTIFHIRCEKNLITIFMSFIKICVLRNFKFCWVSNKNAYF